MNVSKKVITCFDCKDILQKPVLLPCGKSVCQKHVQNDIYPCTSCGENHQSEYVFPNEALEMLLQANFEKLNLGAEHTEASNCCIKLEELADQIESIQKDPSNYIHETISTMRTQVDIIREELKLAVDQKALQIIQDLNQYESECLSSLNTDQVKSTIEEIGQSLTNVKKDLARWTQRLNDFNSNANEWRLVKQNSLKVTSQLREKSSNLKKIFDDKKYLQHLENLIQVQQVNLPPAKKLHIFKFDINIYIFFNR